MRLAAGLAAILCSAAAAPPDMTEQDEARARALFQEVRCVVCQNESIAESQAELAADLRGVVREQVAAGRTDGEIRAFLVQRYGEFVLFRPAVSAGNALLWLGPFAVVLLGGSVLLLRSRRAAAPRPLDEEEAVRLRALAGTGVGEPDERNVA